MGKINILDEVTISKIAAGEIIENPASIVKEMVENSIDAGAKNIIIDIRDSASDYIRITDDGEGMELEDLKVAFERHATSKLQRIEDLDNIVSLGFRGEALASISSVSDMEVITKTKSGNYGTRASVIDSKLSNISKIGAPIGTTFMIKNIFSNVPVRKKYLKSDKRELSNIISIVEKIALGNSKVSIKLIANNKILLNSIANSKEKNHIFSILGKEITSNLINIKFNSQSYSINGYISNNIVFRSNREHQYIYINERYVKNLEITKAIEKFYHTLIPLNRHPIFVLYIDIDPVLIDINIHPKKIEVKLSNENNLVEILEKLVDTHLHGNRKIKSIQTKEKDRDIEMPTIFEIYGDSDENDIENKVKPLNESVGFEESHSIDVINESTVAYVNNAENDRVVEWDLTKDKAADNKDGEELDLSYVKSSRLVGTLFKTYIVLENAMIDTVYLIDQHAAHERVLYEEYKEDYLQENISRQILLAPEVINLSRSEVLILEDNIDVFESLGFLVEGFSESSVIIREVPIIFGMPSYKNMVYDIISQLDTIKNPTESDIYKIMRKACRSAVKSGDKLSTLEIDVLVKRLLAAKHPLTCPHGRPTIIEVPKAKFEEIFLRD